jgi:hypothetical protein
MMKAYIKYCRPFKDDNDEPPIDEMWTDGEKPKKKQADGITLFVYDDIENKLLNERIWDGIE